MGSDVECVCCLHDVCWVHEVACQLDTFFVPFRSYKYIPDAFFFLSSFLSCYFLGSFNTCKSMTTCKGITEYLYRFGYEFKPFFFLFFFEYISLTTSWFYSFACIP